jgi:hypothetical protein
MPIQIRVMFRGFLVETGVEETIEVMVEVEVSVGTREEDGRIVVDVMLMAERRS